MHPDAQRAHGELVASVEGEALRKCERAAAQEHASPGLHPLQRSLARRQQRLPLRRCTKKGPKISVATKLGTIPRGKRSSEGGQNLLCNSVIKFIKESQSNEVQAVCDNVMRSTRQMKLKLAGWRRVGHLHGE